MKFLSFSLCSLSYDRSVAFFQNELMLPFADSSALSFA